MKHGDHITFAGVLFRIEAMPGGVKMVPLDDPGWLIRVCDEAMASKPPDPKLLKMLNSRAKH